MITAREEQMNNVFTKWHIDGLPFNATLHRFSKVDMYPYPHDHPWSFTTHILKGSYIEEMYIVQGKTWRKQYKLREEENIYRIRASHIHRIIELPQGECWTLVLPQECQHEKQESGFWDFRSDGIYYRKWNEKEFKLLNNNV